MAKPTKKPVLKARSECRPGCSNAFRDDPETQEQVKEWLAQLIADRAIERMKAKRESYGHPAAPSVHQ